MMLSYIKNRGVKHLMHFTRVKNIPGILEHGLLSRRELELRGVKYAINDPYRYDYTDSICLSISFPNYKMLYKLRKNHPEEDWAVLLLKTDIIKYKRCAFAYTNAARREIAKSPLSERTTLEALQGMFADHSNMPTRATLDIPSYYTTDPQAEILVLDSIESKYITYVYFDEIWNIKNQKEINRIKMDYNIPAFKHTEKPFLPRKDHKHWINQQDG